MDVPPAQVAVLDGTAHAPGQPWKHGKQIIRTLWGELAWQLGKAEGFELVKESDANGTSPGADLLGTLMTRFAPCVILLDELVVYIRQFVESQALSGGTYDSNLSFIQSLTQAVKFVPNVWYLHLYQNRIIKQVGREESQHLRRWSRYLTECRLCGKRFHQKKHLK